MKNFNFFYIKEHKMVLISIGIFSTLIFFIYFFIFTPINKNFKKNYEIESLEIKLKKERVNLKTVKHKYDTLLKKLEIKEKNFRIIQEENIKNSFNSIPEVELFIKKYLDDNFLKLQTLGRFEKTSENYKVYIPFIFSGEKKDILNFFNSIENSKKFFSFSSSPFKMDFFSETIFSGKILTNVLETTEKKETKKDLISIQNIYKDSIKNFKMLFINNKLYIILNFSNSKKEIFSLPKSIFFDGKNFEVILSNNNLYLKEIN